MRAHSAAPTRSPDGRRDQTPPRAVNPCSPSHSRSPIHSPDEPLDPAPKPAACDPAAARSAQAKDWAQKRAEAIAKAAKLRAEREGKSSFSSVGIGMVHVDFLEKLSAAEQRDQQRIDQAPDKKKAPLPQRRSPIRSQVKRTLKKLTGRGGPSSPLKKKRAAAAAAKLAADKAAQEQRRRETKPSASDPARELALHGYEPLGPIAAGAFSTILRARPMAGGVDVAVKTFDNAKCDKAAIHAEARDRELSVLRLLRQVADVEGSEQHPHIAYMLAEHSGPNSTHAVLEYCPGGSLQRHMQQLQKMKAPVRGVSAGSAAGSSADGVGMPEGQVAQVTLQVASALEHLHKLDVAHRDIKPGNILFDNDGGANAPDMRIKLCDFGFAVKCGGKWLKKLVGTPAYIAPELTGCGLESGYRGRPVDMWALGVVIYEILHGKAPFYGSTLEQLETRIRAVSHSPVEAHVSSGAKSLVHSLLKADPAKRLTVKATLNHSWLKGHVAASGRGTTGRTVPVAVSMA